MRGDSRQGLSVCRSVAGVVLDSLVFKLDGLDILKHHRGSTRVGLGLSIGVRVDNMVR